MVGVSALTVPVNKTGKMLGVQLILLNINAKSSSHGQSLTSTLYNGGDRNKRGEITVLIFTLARLRLKDKLPDTLFCASVISQERP